MKTELWKLINSKCGEIYCEQLLKTFEQLIDGISHYPEFLSPQSKGSLKNYMKKMNCRNLEKCLDQEMNNEQVNEISILMQFKENRYKFKFKGKNRFDRIKERELRRKISFS